MSEIVTHDDYWEAKKQIARLSDAAERGMLAGEFTEGHLRELIGKVFKWEMAHPVKRIDFSKYDLLKAKEMMEKQNVPKEKRFYPNTSEEEQFKGIAYYRNKSIDRAFLPLQIGVIALGICGVIACICNLIIHYK